MERKTAKELHFTPSLGFEPRFQAPQARVLSRLDYEGTFLQGFCSGAKSCAKKHSLTSPFFARIEQIVIESGRFYIDLRNKHSKPSFKKKSNL